MTTGKLDEDKERLLRISELTRKQLARSIHDGPTQSVAALAMRADLARRLQAKDPNAVSAELQKLEELARRTTKEMQHLQFNLHPQSLESSGLIAALEDLIVQLRDLYAQNIELEVELETEKDLDQAVQTQLFFIAAEALSNARKHAEASFVRVKISQPEPEVLLLEVEDDGLGFDTQIESAEEEPERRFGFIILRERVKLLHGELHIESQTGKGTKLRVAVPARQLSAPV